MHTFCFNCNSLIRKFKIRQFKNFEQKMNYHRFKQQLMLRRQQMALSKPKLGRGYVRYKLRQKNLTFESWQSFKSEHKLPFILIQYNNVGWQHDVVLCIKDLFLIVTFIKSE